MPRLTFGTGSLVLFLEDLIDSLQSNKVRVAETQTVALLADLTEASRLRKVVKRQPFVYGIGAEIFRELIPVMADCLTHIRGAQTADALIVAQRALRAFQMSEWCPAHQKPLERVVQSGAPRQRTSEHGTKHNRLLN